MSARTRDPGPMNGRTLRAGILVLLLGSLALGQVHYRKNGAPWNQRARRGPDAVVDGWYYNLGVTGIRVQLIEDQPTRLLVKHVFPDTPAARHVRPGDLITGAGGREFVTPHKNGYGMDVFGPDGPIRDFAEVLEACQAKKASGWLKLRLLRKGKPRSVSLKVGKRYGTFAPTWPVDCKKSERIYAELCRYLAEHQRKDGSWGSPPHDTFAPLALLASGKSSYRTLVKKNVEMHARTTHAQDTSSLINWRYMAAAIVMSEYYLATRERWVLKELEEVYRFLVSSQYMDPAQIHPKTRKERPRDLPRTPEGAIGGWGHNPGFEGYGPICMLTGQGALAFALMKHCGIRVNRALHERAYAFLRRGTGRNGYVWYEDQVSKHDGWADMGRTGAAGIANWLSPYQGRKWRKQALLHARVIGKHPESFPDTHGSPIMGMGYAAMAAHVDPRSFRRLLDANRWWFVLAQCPDGSFYYQPNRDNAGYGWDSRLSASAVTAFIMSMRKPALHVTGKPFAKR